jgi:GntR family transcriptional repressor for pyruvate dehydrogenase complex
MPKSYTPVLKQNLADDLAQRVAQLIRTERLGPGDRLPSIVEMSRRFGVGHPTLREALRKLETLGAIDIRHGSGVYVAASHGTLVLSSTVHGGTATKKVLLDLIEARIPIELKSVALAARNADPASLGEMHRLLELAGAILDDDDALNAANMGFHRTIAGASGNVVLAQLLAALTDLFREEQRVILDLSASRERDLGEHLRILEALDAGDEDEAVRRMREHLEWVRTAIESWDGETFGNG